MIWRFSDGTTAELGGNVEGASLFAQELRAELEHDQVGVQYGPWGHGRWLDRNDPALFDAWLRQEMGRPFRSAQKLKLVEVPEGIPALEVPERKLPDDAIV